MMMCARSTDDKPAVNVDTPLTETVYLVEQHIRINDYSVADDIDCLWPEYATRGPDGS